MSNDELEFIARTDSSALHALNYQTAPVTVLEGFDYMEPRLYCRDPQGQLKRHPYVNDRSNGGPVKDRSRSKDGRLSSESSWTTKPSMSWYGSSASSMASVRANVTYGRYGSRLGDGEMLGAGLGQKPHNLVLKTKMLSQDFYSYRSNGSSFGATRRTINPRRPLVQMNPSYSPRPTKPLRNKPGEAFRKLPKEVLGMVIEELRELHLVTETQSGSKAGENTCSTCFMRDLCSLALVNRQCLWPAMGKLYGTITIRGQSSTGHIKKRFKMKYGGRLKLLRRTLATKPDLSNMVESLRLPGFMGPGVPDCKEDREKYEDMVASIVMACPNLERLEGVYWMYDYGFSRLTHALSTRQRLREHIWHLDGTANELLTYAHARRARRGKMPEEDEALLGLHERWSKLETLAIHSSPSPSTLTATLLEPMFAMLPNLQHLALSNVILPPDIIPHLPPLKSLRLDIPGLTAQMLTDFTRTPLSATLESLTLILPASVLGLSMFAKMLLNLTKLRKLAVTSPTPLELPIGIAIVLHPYLASRSLRYLHWDVAPGTSMRERCYANYILAQAIAAEGFPALKRLRALRDNGGVLQSVCVPSLGWEGAMSQGPLAPTLSRKGSKGDKTADKKSRNSAASTFFSRSSESRHRDLSTNDLMIRSGGEGKGNLTMKERLKEAKVAAQARIEIAKLRPRWKIVAEDWTVVERPAMTGRWEVGGFLGLVGSKVCYRLEEETLDGGLEELLDESDSNGVERMCDGAWNVQSSGWGRVGGHGKREVGREVGLRQLF